MNAKQLTRWNIVLFSLIIPILAGIIGGMTVFVIMQIRDNEQNARIRNFYEDEMSAVVSPNTVKKMIDAKNTNYILVDLRTKAEYDKEHIVTAINIPAPGMTADQIVSAFTKLPKDKEIIVHCYSAYCTLGRTVGKLLSEHGIYVHEMDIGWSEWRYFWPLWNPGAKATDGTTYVTGGTSTSSALPQPCTAGAFGC
ncbi:rhodanese-like domain-containing protein [Patescibacteria group bacterium]|nr:rhodanese-like domain-containing protein [Patescibacteria group bacterium]